MNKIRELRQEKGLTLKELSDELNKENILKVASDTLGKYERGEREPKLKTWQALAKYFNVSVAYLQGLGVSREKIINDLVEKMIDDKDKTFSSFNLLSFELSKKITLGDVSYLNNTFNLNLSNNIVDKLIDNNNRDALRYLVSKYIPFVNDYNFLSSVPSNLDDYYKTLEKKIIDLDNPFNDIFSINTEIDNRDVKIFESVCNLLVLDVEKKDKLINYSDDKKIDISNKIQDLFELLTDETKDSRIFDIRKNIINLLDVYARDDYKLTSSFKTK